MVVTMWSPVQITGVTLQIKKITVTQVLMHPGVRGHLAGHHGSSGYCLVSHLMNISHLQAYWTIKLQQTIAHAG